MLICSAHLGGTSAESTEVRAVVDKSRVEVGESRRERVEMGESRGRGVVGELADHWTRISIRLPGARNSSPVAYGNG